MGFGVFKPQLRVQFLMKFHGFYKNIKNKYNPIFFLKKKEKNTEESWNEKREDIF